VIEVGGISGQKNDWIGLCEAACKGGARTRADAGDDGDGFGGGHACWAFDVYLLRVKTNL
jgi:hypothetical protein